MHRSFLSLKFTAQQQQRLYAVGQSTEFGLQAWHPADNLHLTLVFLGQQHETAQQQLWRDCLRLFQLRCFEPVELTLDHFAVFGQARVLYLGVSQPPEALMLLQQQLQQLALPFLNAPVTEPFVPHVTLARKFQSAGAFPIAIEPLSLLCTEIALYHSISTEQGVSYQSVETYTLVPKG